jgi:hypothetical protein
MHINNAWNNTYRLYAVHICRRIYRTTTAFLLYQLGGFQISSVRGAHGLHVTLWGTNRKSDYCIL